MRENVSLHNTNRVFFFSFKVLHVRNAQENEIIKKDTNLREVSTLGGGLSSPC